MAPKTKTIMLLIAATLGVAGVSGAQAATCAAVGPCFSFIGGGATVNGGLSASTGSWFSMLAMDTNSDAIPDANLYTAMRAAGTTGTPGPNGSLNFSQINPITIGAGGTNHNSGNMIDRDWSFFGGWGAHFTNQVLEVTGTGASRSVDMHGWSVAWNGVAIDMGQGSPAVISAGVDGLWNTDDETLDYNAIVPNDGTTNFGGVAYGFHMAGTYNPYPEPLPAAVWLLGSGLLGLIGVGRRRKACAVQI